MTFIIYVLGTIALINIIGDVFKWFEDTYYEFQETERKNNEVDQEGF